MDKILKAPTASFAENVTKEIKGFDEAAWNKVLDSLSFSFCIYSFKFSPLIGKTSNLGAKPTPQIRTNSLDCLCTCFD